MITTAEDAIARVREVLPDMGKNVTAEAINLTFGDDTIVFFKVTETEAQQRERFVNSVTGTVYTHSGLRHYKETRSRHP